MQAYQILKRYMYVFHSHVQEVRLMEDVFICC